MNKLTILRDDIKNKNISIKEVLDNIYIKIENDDKVVDSFLTLTKDYAYKRAEILQSKLDNNEDIGILGGIPIAIKDNIAMKDVKLTCASRMLEDYISIYDATVVKKLVLAGAIIIGKTNMDEFAMGSSTEKSSFKVTKNPYDLTRVPGGSSGGSAAALACDFVYASIGSDTGGSIRQPAAFCNLFGLKPSYGLVSRYGLVAYASSFDQIGPFTKTTEDMAIMLNAITGIDKRDATSIDTTCDYTKHLVNDISNLKIGVPKSFLTNLSDDIKESFNRSLELLESLNAKIINVDFEYIKYSLSTYYIITTAEASSNLARFDAIRYGYRSENYSSLDDIYVKSRTESLGEEVKKRIMLGSYVLSAGCYDAYYKKADIVREKIANEFKYIFKSVDVIAMPTTPSIAFKIGENSNNPIEMYLQDIFTVPVNIARLPAISVPSEFVNNMPVGLQFIADYLREDILFNLSYTYEKNTEYYKIQPNI